MTAESSAQPPRIHDTKQESSCEGEGSFMEASEREFRRIDSADGYFDNFLINGAVNGENGSH